MLRQGAREEEAGGEGGVAVGAVGCKLAQSIFALPRAHSEPLLASLAALSPAQLLAVARHPHGSRVLEAACATIVSAAPLTLTLSRTLILTLALTLTSNPNP